MRSDEPVAVLMTEGLARDFERKCLGEHTETPTRLSAPLPAWEAMGRDIPTYRIDLECD